ncbi:MAG: hypothetical protein MPI95_07095 [Nitrosopumilus sp.]|nr:hypothetical protein [Nitrosopumilus sp.]MDA7941136.1 hypothetical protein [Nitrosopumilus sp.]MDA7942466.1 hypothetical protein [Nitrosopumilus sp.]MDA7945514.1 hypothetical protein [Nitrosopumilus sp.]MDA7953517.1 hypothetical protein [Nitrosopumilus sp.]
MERRGKVLVAVLVAASVAVFGYTQYASASQIRVGVAESEDGRITLEFENPSLLPLAAGSTEFMVISGGEAVGSGRLDPFMLPPLGGARADGTYEQSGEASGDVVITGTTEYDVLFASLRIPFVHHATEEQASEFIRGG